MVEKISEVSMKFVMSGDSTPDDNPLLKHIKKKKYEQGYESNLLFAMFPPSSLDRVTASLAQEGRLSKTENQAVKKDVYASLEFVSDTWQAKKGDCLRRQVTLAVAGLNTTRPPKNKVTNTLSSKVVDVPKSEGLTTTSVPVCVATATFVDTVTKNQRFATAQQLQTVAMANSTIGNKTNQEVEVEVGRQEHQLRTENDIAEARWLWQGAKPLENLLPKQSETRAKSKNSSATLQQFKTITNSVSESKGGNGDQMLEVNYQFQRWPGDHFVKVSVPTGARREGKITLLPSDVRAADALLRNMNHLIGLTPDLLQPQQEQDEKQQRRQQLLQDEDQE